MAGNKNQKMKILYLLKIFQEKTDKEHQLTINDIIEELLNYGISCERKSVYSDLKYLKEAGYPIIMTKSKDVTYYLAPVSLNFADIKLIADALQAANFISRGRSNEIISKLEKHTNEYNIPKLHKRMLKFNKNTAVPENLYEVIDLSYEAISEKKKLIFKYEEHEKEMPATQYTVSPYMMTWTDNNYYLIAGNKSFPGGMKFFCTDKMTEVKLLNRKAGDETEITGDLNFNINDFIKNSLKLNFNSGDRICIKIHNSLITIFFDKFAGDKFAGKVEVEKVNEDYFLISLTVELTPDFILYLFRHGGMLEIVSPKKLIDYMERLNERVYIMCQ
jgi:predicted DNA-binding transcriptional regulator YafY